MKKRAIGNTPEFIKYETDETTTRAEEMAALDCFGPLAREAIMNAPISVLAHGTLGKTIAEYEKVKEQSIAKFKEKYPHVSEDKIPEFPELNLKDPKIDMGIAHGIMMSSYNVMLIDRDGNDRRTKEERARDAALSLQPIIPKRLRRSVR